MFELFVGVVVCLFCDFCVGGLVCVGECGGGCVYEVFGGE